MKTGASVLLVCIFISFPALSQNYYLNKASDLLDRYYELEQLNGEVLIAEKDSIMLHKVFGYSDFDASEKLKPNALFILASISKSITALGILKLAERGMINLDDSVTRFFPELPYGTVTIRHLLSNTGGIPEYRALFIEKWDRTKTAGNADVIDMMAEAKLPLLFEPGTRFSYSNTGFVLLASIIEKVSGKSLEIFLQDEIFSPLEMERSMIFTSDRQYEIDNFAFPFFRTSNINPMMIRPETIESLSWILYLDSIKGDVSTASTAEDLFKLDRALVNGKFIDPGLMKKAFTPLLSENAEGEGYGYGWYISVNKNGDKIVSHDGTMPGINAFNQINLTDERTIIVLSNTNYTRSQQIAENVASIFENEEPVYPKPPLAVELEKYIAEKGVEGFRKFATELSAADSYEAAEADMNILGYMLLGQGNIEGALEIFKFNTELYPESWNVYDSLGEGYMAAGKKELAIKNYRKSIELNPDNQNGKDILERLLAE